MSRKSNSSLKVDNSNFLFPEIYISSGDNLFCVSYFQSNPDKLDLRNPSEKLKECQDRLQSEELTQQERFAILSQMNSIQKMLHTESSVEFLRSEAELGYFYNENMNPQSAIRHLEKAHSLEKAFKIDQEESINIAAETALAHLLLKKKGSDHISKADEALKPYYKTNIPNSMIRFKRDLSRSRIFSAQKRYRDAVQSFEQTILSLQEVNENQHSYAEAQLYIEMARTIEIGSKSIPDAKEKASECYMNAHKIFLEIGDRESANKIDPNKLPQHYREELEHNDEELLNTPLNKDKIEFVSNDNKPFEESPNNIRKEIIKFQNRLEDDGGKVKIAYLPENVSEDSQSTKNDDESEQQTEPLSIPPPSKIVDSNLSQQQIYLLTHNQPQIPQPAKVEDARKYVDTDETAQAITTFNNAILQMSRFKSETEKTQNNNKNTEPEEDPLVKFRSSRRKK